MKLSIQILAVQFFAALVTVSGNGEVFLTVMTMLHVEEPLPQDEVASIETQIDAIKSELDQIVVDVAAEDSLNRNLRGTTERQLCVNCPNIAPRYPICFVNGVPKDRCDRRAVQEHQELTEDALNELHETDRNRYLQVATLCKEAKTGISNALSDAVTTPPGGTFIEKCFYEYDDSV